MNVRALPWFVLVAVLGFGAASPASGYRHKTSERGDPVRWPAGTVAIDADLDGEPGLEAAATRAVVARVLAHWARHLPDALGLVLAPAPEGRMPTEYDRLNVVRWVVDDHDPDYEPEALATTMVTYATRSGVILDADIVVNAIDNPWTIVEGPCERGYDLENALSHEVGHLLGLAHEIGRRDATMYPSMSDCDTDKRDLSDDDIAGVQTLYADIETAPGCSAGGAAAGLLVPLLAWACLLWRRRLTRIALVTAGVAALAAPASATTLRQLSLGELTAAADLVVRGRVVAQRVVAEGGRIYTDSLLAIDHCWRGACPRSLSVRQLGGERDGVGLIVDGVTALGPGDEVVLFLRPRRQRYRSVAMGQGVFQVRGELAVRDLRDLQLVDGPGTPRPGTLERVPIGDLKAAVERAPGRSGAR